MTLVKHVSFYKVSVVGFNYNFMCDVELEFNGPTTNSEILEQVFNQILESKRKNQMIDTASNINKLALEIHNVSKQWWTNLETGEPIKRNVGELLMLTVSELSEAMEGDRKGLMDDKLPHRKMFEVELADAMIRILDMAAGMKLDIGGALVEKMAYNATREDHKIKNRKLEGGKKY